FEFKKPKHRIPMPSTTKVKINERERKVYIGDAGTKALVIFSFDGRQPASIKLDNIPVSMTDTPRGVYLTMIGSFMPSDDPKGALAFMPGAAGAFGAPQMVLTNLPRPTYSEFADLN